MRRLGIRGLCLGTPSLLCQVNYASSTRPGSKKKGSTSPSSKRKAVATKRVAANKDKGQFSSAPVKGSQRSLTVPPTVSPLEEFFATAEHDEYAKDDDEDMEEAHPPAPTPAPSSSGAVSDATKRAIAPVITSSGEKIFPSSDALVSAEELRVGKIIPPEYVMPEPQDRFTLFDPREHDALYSTNGAMSDEPTPLKRAFEQIGAAGIWKQFHGNSGKVTPPAWLEAFCRDIYFRSGGDVPLSAVDPTVMDTATDSEPSPIHTDASAQTGVDPFLFIDFSVRAEADYTAGPYVFPTTFSSLYGDTETRAKLCLGDLSKEYLCFADGYCFPDRRQLPTSVGTIPLKLYVDPKAQKPCVFIALSDEIPPAMWLPVKPEAAAVRRVVAEFASHATTHRDAYHEMYLEKMSKAHRTLQLQRLPDSDGDILRMMAFQMRDVTFGEAPIGEFPNTQEFFLGEYDEPEKLLEYLDLCPHLFSTPLMRTIANVHSKAMVPLIDGPGVATSLYRCVYSKALLLVQVNLAAEVKLPPHDPQAFEFLWKDSQQAPKSKIPIFVRVIWPDNKRMCGGGKVVERFNTLFGTEFAHDTPVDACLAVFSTMTWAREQANLLGVLGMRKRVAEMELVANSPQPALLYPGTREIPNPEYTADERLGMHIQYLAHLGDPEVKSVITRLLRDGTAAVRMGCAKAALIIGDRELFRSICSNEPQGRMQYYMTKLVRRRKARDLTDAVPRLLDDQYEFAAPLWTNRGKRLDPNTLSGSARQQMLK